MKNLVIILLLSFLSWSLHASCEKISDLDAAAWSFKAMMASYNLDFIAYDLQMKKSKKYYTKEAWEAYNQNLNKTNAIEEIKKNRLTVQVGSQTSPMVVSNIGQKLWQIQFPLIVNAQSVNKSESKRFNFFLSIIQDDKCQLKIFNWVGTPYEEKKKTASNEYFANQLFNSFISSAKIEHSAETLKIIKGAFKKSKLKRSSENKEGKTDDVNDEALDQLKRLQEKLILN